MTQTDISRQWALLRFSIIAELLASPPEPGTLNESFKTLSEKSWVTPAGKQHRFGKSTIERWYYIARDSKEPVEALRRKHRKDIGEERVMSPKLFTKLHEQYKAYPQWSRQLHADNVSALVEQSPELGPAPSYSTILRRMNKQGWHKRPKARTPGQKSAQLRKESREIRSFEKEYPHALWHFDFHEAKRSVLMPDGTYIKPHCLGILDDHSRVCCHIQWYFQECSETLAHGLTQAFLKRGLPSAVLSDCGKAMQGAEIKTALEDLSITHNMTLPYSPYQNGKQEAFWNQVEGRLMALLDAVSPLTIEFLNKSTQAWVEMEYNRSYHSEIGMSPIEKMLNGHNVARHTDIDFAQLQFHFTRIITRVQRKSDGTVSVNGVRFEIPSSMRHHRRITLRHAQWAKNGAYIVDPKHHSQKLAHIIPLDKLKNADGKRRSLQKVDEIVPDTPKNPIPPLLQNMINEYNADGSPSGYLPHTKEMSNA